MSDFFMYNPGDILSVRYPLFTHYGIYIGDDRVIHNSRELGRVREVSFNAFSKNRPVTLSSIKPDDPLLAIERARKYLGRPYRFFSENCEHFVRMVSGLVKESTQVQKYTASAFGAGAFLMADHPMVKGAGAGATIGALLTPREESPIGLSLLCALAGAVIGGCFATDGYSSDPPQNRMARYQ